MEILAQARLVPRGFGVIVQRGHEFYIYTFCDEETFAEAFRDLKDWTEGKTDLEIHPTLESAERRLAALKIG